MKFLTFKIPSQMKKFYSDKNNPNKPGILVVYRKQILYYLKPLQRSVKLLLSILIFTLFSSNIMSQQKIDPRVAELTNITALMQFAEESDAKFKAEFAIAEAAAIINGWPIVQELDDGRIIRLQRLDEQGFPIYYVSENIVSASLLNTDLVHSSPFNLTGSGINIGEWDSGNIRATHEQFSGRVTNNEGSSISSHSTHVCGTLIGDGTGDAAAKGMAPSATVDGYNSSNDVAEMTTEAALGMIISNHSYGILAGWGNANGCANWYGNTALSTTESHWFGLYGNIARNMDIIAANAPFYLIVRSAGNDRNDAPGASHYHNVSDCSGTLQNDVHPQDGQGTLGGGFDCVQDGKTAKNVLTVGALNDDGITQTTFSNWGPTDDGRIKPDICANGLGLYSSDSASDSDYSSKNGTSMASPSVAGSCALIQEHAFDQLGGFLLSATMKALVIHTATDIGNPGPDYSNGWGRMNSLAAVQQIDEDLVNPLSIQELTLNDGDSYSETVFSNSTEPLEVTIVWTDPAGTAQTGLNVTTSNLVNDLDLRITGPGGPFMPWILNPANPANNATTGDNTRDNVENILIQNPGVGDYTITVDHKGALGAAQNFSIIISGTSECLPLSVICPPADLGTIACNEPIPPTANNLAELEALGLSILQDCGPITIDVADVFDPPADICGGQTMTRTYTISDGVLMEMCVQTLTISPPPGPMIVCPANITISCDESDDPLFTGMASASVVCGPAPDVYYADIVVDGNCNWECTIERTWTAEDDCGNTESCVQNITCTPLSLIQDALSMGPIVIGLPGVSLTLTLADAECIVEWLSAGFGNAEPSAIPWGNHVNNVITCQPGPIVINPDGTMTNPLLAAQIFMAINLCLNPMLGDMLLSNTGVPIHMVLINSLPRNPTVSGLFRLNNIALGNIFAPQLSFLTEATQGINDAFSFCNGAVGPVIGSTELNSGDLFEEAEDQSLKNSFNGDFSIFPNPANNEVYFDLSAYSGQSLLIEIYNLQGQLVIERKVEEVFDSPLLFNLNNFKDAVYMAVIHIEGENLKTKKFLVKKE
jgi:hypothetical protein